MNTTTTLTRPLTHEALVSGLGGTAATAVMRGLADEFSSRIMFSAIEEAKTVEEISGTQGIPLSTCYRRVRELVDGGLLVVERIVITPTGKRYALYRTVFKSFDISAGPSGVVTSATVNEDVAEKLRTRKLSMSCAPDESEDVRDRADFVLGQGRRATL